MGGAGTVDGTPAAYSTSIPIFDSVTAIRLLHSVRGATQKGQEDVGWFANVISCFTHSKNPCVR